MAETDRICRFCKAAGRNMMDLFGTDEQSEQLRCKLSKLFHFEILESEIRPNKICKKCLSKLHQLWEFVEMVEENEKTFAREVILKSETDSFLSIYVVKEEDSLENGLCEDDTRGGESEEETVNEPHSTEEKIDPNYSDEGESDREEIKETTQTNVNGHKSSEVDKVISEFMKLTCNLCSIETQTFANLRRHFTAVHKINSGYATCCQLRFRRRHMLYEHILHHKNPNIFTCEICGKRCKSTDKLKEHKKSHMSEEMKKFECLTCHMKFATNAKMKHHSLVHIPDDKKTEQCSKCDRKFANRALLNTHIRVIHDKIRNFVCEICAKPFLSLSSLTAHQIVHHDLKQSKIKCDHCGKMYSTASTLKSHIDRVKDSNKIHQCDKCNHISPNLKALKAHQSYSHKVDPVLYNCSICGRTFKKRTNLKEHMSVHTGEKLYTCSFCPKEFNSSANKYSHQKKNHPEEWAEQNKKRLYS